MNVDQPVRRVLVTLDGSPLAKKAVPFAAHLARLANAPVQLLRVHPDWNAWLLGNQSVLHLARERRELAHTQAVQELAETARELEDQGIPTDTLVRAGDPGSVIAEVLEQHQVDLLVMSTHGRSGVERMLFGSVAEQVLHVARVPILLIPPECAVDWTDQEHLRILVALDGSPRSEAVLPAAGTIARSLNAELHLLSVVGPRLRSADRKKLEQYLHRVASGLLANDRVRSHVAEGAAVSAITAYAREHQIDLIAMSTHGHRGLARLVMGSVTAATLLQANVPVLVVRPTRLERSAEDPIADSNQPMADEERIVDPAAVPTTTETRVKDRPDV